MVLDGVGADDLRVLDAAAFHGGVWMVDGHDDDGFRSGHDALGTHAQRGVFKAVDAGDAD